MIFIGIDDTDNPQGGGTGRVARSLAALLRAEGLPVLGVSRHQLLVDPRVPYTRNNSSNVIHLLAEAADGAALADRLAGPLRAACLEGSDPGLCVAGDAAADLTLGRAAQEELVSQAQAFAAAEACGAVLRPLGGTGGGIIGAMAGVALAAGGEDGRFVDVGRARELSGVVSVEEILAAGIAGVCTRDGSPVTRGTVDTRAGRVRPALRAGQPFLLVESTVPGHWRVLELGKRRSPGSMGTVESVRSTGRREASEPSDRSDRSDRSEHLNPEPRTLTSPYSP